MTKSIDSPSERGDFVSQPPTLDPQQLAELRAHVVNMEAGQFSSDGQFSTSAEDIDAIFGEHVPQWAKARGERDLRIVLYAHGGLTSEAWGLVIAAKQVQWWKENGVYPIFFVWETGVWESLGQIIGRAGREVATESRGISDIWDAARDRMLESVCRRLGGRSLWSAMKQSAVDAFAKDGAGRYTLKRLRGLCKEHKNVKLHAVGHSAGSILLSHAILNAKEQKLPRFTNAHFLAPAVTVDLFNSQVLNLIGNKESDQVEHLSLFALHKEYELADSAGPYGKSILYLVRHALETNRDTPILGLEESLRQDSGLAELFGLGANSATDNAELIWAVTEEEDGRSASLSTTHSGFDDDPATMNSVLRRVLEVEDGYGIEEFPTTGFRGSFLATSAVGSGTTNGCRGNGTGVHVGNSRDHGRRIAQCIGINKYPSAPLSGCVADADHWGQFFRANNFEVRTPIVDDAATKAGILDAVKSIVESAVAGDVVAIHYSGHGTQIPDQPGSSDESNGDTPDQDEALVPIDYLDSGLIIDDDLGEICSQLKEGVNLTFFFDCCHSGTATRIFFQRGARSASGSVARYLPVTEAVKSAHYSSRRAKGARGSIGYAGRGEILLSACRSSQVAWETNGKGDFTRHALAILSEGFGRLSYEQFIRKVNQKFGGNRRQHPELWCDTKFRKRLLLTPHTRSADQDSPGEQLNGLAADPRDATDALMQIRQIADRQLD